MQLAHEDIEARVIEVDASVPPEGLMVWSNGMFARSGRPEQAREGVHRVGLRSVGDLDHGVSGADDGQGLRAGMNTAVSPTHLNQGPGSSVAMNLTVSAA